MKKYSLFFLEIILIFIFVSCGKSTDLNRNKVVIAIANDVESLNPLFSFDLAEGNISELLFLSLVQHRWSETDKQIKTFPLLAEDWKWNKDSTEVTFDIRKNLLWSDGKPITSADVVFSFDVYSDPLIQSKWYGGFEKFFTDQDHHIVIEKSFKIITPKKFKIFFPQGAHPNLYDLDMPIIPKHILAIADRNKFGSLEFNSVPVTSGPYKFSSWKKNQSIILTLNEKSFLSSSASPKEIIFMVIPDYNSRLTQLKNGEIDLMEEVKPEDASDLKSNTNLLLKSVKGREYEYVGWNNIDPQLFHDKKKAAPNKLFGNPNVRRALTYAINRREILEEYLLNYGDIANDPVSPIFKYSQNNDSKYYEYNPVKARQLLKKEGWKDSNNNGIIDKNGIEFKFDLYIPAGNPRRNYSSIFIKNNFKQVGIDMNVQTIELGLFIDKLFDKQMDAWIAAWFIPLPTTLKISWYSDLNSTPLNFASYQNKKADRILDLLETQNSEIIKDSLFKEFRKLIRNDEPVTFLYWMDNIVGYNSKIKNIKINPLGVVHHCWEWSVKN